MNKPLEITINPDGVVVLTFTGDLLEADMPAFKSELEAAATMISTKASEKKIKTLLDMTHFTGKFSTDAMRVLAQFATNNEPYIEKTASFGGDHMIQMAGTMVTHLAHRDNIKIFDTKEDALNWLAE